MVAQICGLKTKFLLTFGRFMGKMGVIPLTRNAKDPYVFQAFRRLARHAGINARSS